MADSARDSRVIVLGARPLPGELIASYLRHRLPDVDVTLCASYADLKGGCAGGILLIETSASTAQNIGEAVARVRSDHPRAPILIATAFPNPDSATAAIRYGAQGVVSRLRPLSALATAVETLLAGRTCFPHLAVLNPRRDGDAENASRQVERHRADEGDVAPVSVELAMIQGAPMGRYAGPCRRRGASTGWRGPERRRPRGR